MTAQQIGGWIPLSFLWRVLASWRRSFPFYPLACRFGACLLSCDIYLRPCGTCFSFVFVTVGGLPVCLPAYVCTLFICLSRLHLCPTSFFFRSCSETVVADSTIRHMSTQDALRCIRRNDAIILSCFIATPRTTSSLTTTALFKNPTTTSSAVRGVADSVRLRWQF